MAKVFPNSIVYSGFSGMAVINGVLTPINAESVIVDAKGHIHYKTDKGEFTDIKIYAGRDEFERDCPQVVETPTRTNGIPITETTDNEGQKVIKANVWQMINGEPAEVTIDAQFGVTSNRLYWAEIILPANTYATRIDCLSHETYKYVDEDGTIKERDGIAKKVRLTDEQKAFIEDTFVPALKKLNELGIGVVFQTSNDELYAYNANNDIGAVYSCDIADDVQRADDSDLYRIFNPVIQFANDETVYCDGKDIK